MHVKHVTNGVDKAEIISVKERGTQITVAAVI